MSLWFKLSRDGVDILTVREEKDLVRYIHLNHSYSYDHAIKYEGYRVTLVEVP